MMLTLEPYFERLAMEDEHPNGLIGHVCGACNRPVHERPCPDHAPTEIPGLTLVECEAEPRHWMWVHAGDYYPPPCPRCQLQEYWEKDRQARQCRHWPWRRWTFTHWLAGKAYVLGVTSSGGGWINGDGHNGCIPDMPMIRGKRPYILGASRETWRCWLIGHHRRGEEVGLGFCGKCVPWPCCGSTRVEHVPGCREDV